MSRVLLVDDDDLLRETLAEALRAAGMIVSEADNGAAGFTMVAGGGFDLVVTDLYMPDGDGLELLMRMRDAAIATPVIMMTGGVKDDFGTPDPVTEPSLRAARIFGAVRTLRKPVLPSELMREIGAVAAQPGHDK